MASIGPLALKLTTNAGPMEHGLNAAQSRLSQFAQSGPIAAVNQSLTNMLGNIPGANLVTGALGSIGEAALGLLNRIPLVGPHLATIAGALGPVGLGAAIVTTGLGMLAKAGFDSIMSLKNLADIFLLGAERAIALGMAFDIVGLNQQVAERHMARFTTKMGELEANPAGPLAANIRRLGVDVEHLVSLPVDQQLAIVADAFNGLESASERARLGNQLFGKGWIEMREWLSRGSAGLAEATRLSIALGISMSDLDMHTVNEAGNRMMRMWAIAGTVFKSFANTAAIAIAPAVHAVADFASNVIVMVQPLLQIFRDLAGAVMAFFGFWAQLAVGVIGIVLPVFDGLFRVLGAVWNVIRSLVGAVLAPFQAAIAAIGGAAAGAINPFEVIGNMMGAVAAAINFVAGAIAMLGQFIAGLVGGAIAGLVEVLDVLWTILQVIIEVALIPFRIAWELIAGTATEAAPIFDTIGSILGTVAQAFGLVAGVIGGVVIGLLDGLLAGIQGIIEAFGGLFGLLSRIPGIGGAFTGVAEAAQAAAQRIRGVRDNLNGAQQAGAQLADQAEQSAAARRAEQLQEDVDKLMTNWGESAQFFGLAGRALEIAKLEAKGASEEQLNQLRAQDEILSRLEQEQKLRERINQTMNAMRTPLEIAQAGFLDLEEQLAGGLNVDVAARQALALIEQMEKAAGIGEIKAPAAIAEGSAEALSTIHRAQMSSRTHERDPQERVREALEILQQIQTQQRDELVSIREALVSGSIFQEVQNP